MTYATDNESRSHRHGTGRFAREAYGKRSDCKECSRRDAQFEAARLNYGIKPQPLPTPGRFDDGTTFTTDRGIIKGAF